MDASHAAAIATIAVASIILAVVAATETALERANVARIQALAARGDARALRIVGTVEKPREVLGPLTTARVLAAAAVVIGFVYIGASTYSVGQGAVIFGLIGALLDAVVQMTVGILAARRPEFTAIEFSGVVRVTGWIFTAPAFVLGLPARLIARSLAVVTPNVDEDILSLVEREEATGGVEEQERRMIRGIIALEDKTAREIMVPRMDIAAAEVGSSLRDVAMLATERGYSRIPVYRDSIDDIVGIAYAKDLLQAVLNGGADKRLEDLVRKPVFIPESKRLDELLTEMRATRTHMAIVVDEYGGTAGLVTIEDLLEEIVGEIEDEYDIAQPTIEVISEDEVLLDAGVGTDVLRDLFDFEVESEEFETVGGFLIHELGRLPQVGDEVTVDGLMLRVLSMSGRRIRRLRISRVRNQAAEGASAATG
ncbi:MAG: hemolysin family protein [Dehalococcoidia bacterium]